MPNRISSVLARRPLLTAVVYTVIAALPLYLVGAQVLQLSREVDFGVGRLGIATATFFGSAALAANLAGRVMPRIGSVQGLRFGSVLIVASCLMAATAAVWWMVPVAMAVGGVANGLIQIAANLAIFDGVVAGRQGLAFGSKQAAVPLASVLAGVSLPVVGLVFGWRWVFVAAAALGLLLALSVPHFSSMYARDRREPAMGRPPRSLVFLAVGGICGAAAGNGIALFIVASAVEIGFDESVAGVLLATFSILVVGVRVGAGWLVDRRQSSGHLEMIWLAGAGAVGAFILMAASTPGPYLIAMPLAVLGAWGWAGVFFFTVVNAYPEFPARATGLVLSGNLMGTVTGPFVVGLLAGRGNYSAAWLFVSVAAAMSTLGFVLSYRLRPRPALVNP